MHTWCAGIQTFSIEVVLLEALMVWIATVGLLQATTSSQLATWRALTWRRAWWNWRNRNRLREGRGRGRLGVPDPAATPPGSILWRLRPMDAWHTDIEAGAVAVVLLEAAVCRVAARGVLHAVLTPGGRTGRRRRRGWGWRRGGWSWRSGQNSARPGGAVLGRVLWMDSRGTAPQAGRVPAVLLVALETTLTASPGPSTIMSPGRGALPRVPRVPGAGAGRAGCGRLPGIDLLAGPGAAILRWIGPVDARGTIRKAGTVLVIPLIALVAAIAASGAAQAIVAPGGGAAHRSGRFQGQATHLDLACAGAVDTRLTRASAELTRPGRAPALRVLVIHTWYTTALAHRNLLGFHIALGFRLATPSRGPAIGGLRAAMAWCTAQRSGKLHTGVAVLFGQGFKVSIHLSHVQRPCGCQEEPKVP